MLLISFELKLFLLRIFYFFNITFDIYIEIIFGDNIQDLFYAEIKPDLQKYLQRKDHGTLSKIAPSSFFFDIIR